MAARSRCNVTLRGTDYSNGYHRGVNILNEMEDRVRSHNVLVAWLEMLRLRRLFEIQPELDSAITLALVSLWLHKT